MSTYVHTHLHSHYSLLDGLSKVPEIVKKVLALKMPGVALTDHGNLMGAIEFYKACKEAKINPIVGIEGYLVGDRNKAPDKNNDYWHITLLAKNEIGYRNLLLLSSDSFLNGFHFKPRMDLGFLFKHKEGLIATSGCLSGPVAKSLQEKDQDKAFRMAKMFKKYFEDDFYIEVMKHGLEEQDRIYNGLVEIGQSLGIKVVATNDAHYPNKEDRHAHDALLCIQRRKLLTDPDHPTYRTDEFYIKSREEMEALFPSEFLDTSLEINEKCHLEIPFDQRFFPTYPIPEDSSFIAWRKDRKSNNTDGFDYLMFLCKDFFKEKAAKDKLQEYKDRLCGELKVIKDKGISDYFLVVYDFVNYAKSKDIKIGLGRGSAAGSLVSYLLGITGIDPLKYGLLFERFLNPHRTDFPDIDIDIEDTKRQEVVDYVIDKYGKERTSYIGTVAKMQAKGVLKDAGRVLGYSIPDINEITEKIPVEATQREHFLQELVNTSKEIKALSEAHPKLFEIALKLEGTARHLGIHAAGVIVSSVPILEMAPVHTVTDDSGKRIAVSQWDKDTIDKVGLTKIDFLGLINLRIIGDTIQSIEKLRGKKVILPL